MLSCHDNLIKIKQIDASIKRCLQCYYSLYSWIISFKNIT